MAHCLNSDDLVDTYVNRLQQALKEGSIDIHPRIKDIHQDDLEPDPTKSYINTGLSIPNIVKAVINQPSAIRATDTVQDDKIRYVLESDFSHVIGSTPKDSNGSRVLSSRIQITIGEPSDKRISAKYSVFLLKLLREQDTIKIKVIHTCYSIIAINFK